jgi:hypothetical protein
MIEFTTLELTLLALCVILFFRNSHNAIKAKAFFHCIDAMCEDERVMAEVRKQRSKLIQRHGDMK